MAWILANATLVGTAAALAFFLRGERVGKTMTGRSTNATLVGTEWDGRARDDAPVPVVVARVPFPFTPFLLLWVYV